MDLQKLHDTVGSIKHIIDELPNEEKNEVRKFINEYIPERICLNCNYYGRFFTKQPCRSCEDFDKFENGKQSDSICGTSKY
jgi:hypothetical protein